jgi:predicted GNAT superfamily acetyltransferase
MTQQDIIDMAEKAGIARVVAEVNIDIMQAFTELIAKAKAEEIAVACEKLPFGDTAQSFATWIREQAQ